MVNMWQKRQTLHTPETEEDGRRDTESVFRLPSPVFSKPLDVAALASYRLKQIGRRLLHKKDQNIFRAGLGRLARVGYSSRFVDALFSISILARGRVPGDAGAVAALVLLFEFFWEIVVMAVLVAGGYMLWENLRELWA